MADDTKELASEDALRSLRSSAFTLGLVFLLALTALSLGTLHLLALPLITMCQSVVVFLVASASFAPLLRHHLPERTPGPANVITLFRLVIVAWLAGLVGHTGGSVSLGVVLCAVGLLSIVLDGIDGPIARRRRQQTAFGARFDMEVDALFVLALSILAYQLDKVGPWIILAGAMRYLFIGAGLVFPRLAAPLPQRLRRRTICVVQEVSLLICLVPFVVRPITTVVGAASILVLLSSFAADVVWLLRQPAVRQTSWASPPSAIRRTDTRSPPPAAPVATRAHPEG
jgi:phosphatidylglycerophosphate synthase